MKDLEKYGLTQHRRYQTAITKNPIMKMMYRIVSRRALWVRVKFGPWYEKQVRPWLGFWIIECCCMQQCILANVFQGWLQGGDWDDRPSPENLRKWLYSPWLCTIRETAFAIQGHFVVHCFVTALLWSMLHLSYSGEPVMTFDCQILLKWPSPSFTGWICPWCVFTVNFSSLNPKFCKAKISSDFYICISTCAFFSS